MNYLLDANVWITALRRPNSSLAARLIGPLDMQIAAIPIANGCTLVTHNTAEFRRVQGLLLDDWQRS